MMLFLFGAVFGNKPQFFGNSFGTVDLSVPAYTAMIIATTGLVSLTITIASGTRAWCICVDSTPRL